MELDFESDPRGVSGPARELRGPARSAAAPHQEARGRTSTTSRSRIVTQQYLDYIDLMQEMNLDVAGEFLVMAATLIHIKSRMLLPRPDPTQEDPDEDPREALVRRLLEHQKFKAAAELLHERETLRSAQWTRPDGPVAEVVGEAPEPEVEVDLFSLMAAFRQVRRARQAAAARSTCRPSRSRSRPASSSCCASCRRRRRAASRSCSPTCRRAPG